MAVGDGQRLPPHRKGAAGKRNELGSQGAAIGSQADRPGDDTALVVPHDDAVRDRLDHLAEAKHDLGGRPLESLAKVGDGRAEARMRGRRTRDDEGEDGRDEQHASHGLTPVSSGPAPARGER